MKLLAWKTAFVVSKLLENNFSDINIAFDTDRPT